MAEEVVFAVVEKIVTELGYLAVQEIGSGSAWGVYRELKDLQNTTSTIKALLLHAEEMQVNNPAVKEWLRRIKDVAYEAEDVIDEFSMEATRKKLFVQETRIKKVCYFVLPSNPIFFRFKMVRRIREINRTLTRIAIDKSFQLEVRIPSSKRVHTHSYVDESTIFGREDIKQKTVELLLDFDGVDRLTILPVQGLGGIGKTTLAKLVYNDKRVDAHFKIKMWVCISEKFDVNKIIVNIIESATKRECPKLKMDLLQSHLREEINGKKFLLVLDDVWNEDAEKWDILKELLMGGARGSKIIVTTRSQKVASIMGTVSTQQLSELSPDDCWNLFKQRAFEAGQEERHPNLVEIGIEIVRKCGGVPLAAKTLGSLMRSKTEEHEWLHVKDSDIWKLPQKENDILPALRLSYNHMSYSLRQCFAYCSLFPKGCVINKWRLIFLWISQGYITSPDGDDNTLQEIGSQYVKELLWRSLFQDRELIYDETISFKMHDLVHDLAQSVAGVECFTLKKDTEEHIPQGVRHLCIDGESFPLRSLKTPDLRTLILNSQSYHLNGVSISTLKLLRVLVLENYCDDYLPDSIGKLKHLRFLQIISNSLTKLPKSITKLQSLQYLNIWCEKLERLPKDMEKMIGLKSIVVRSDSRLTHMPKGIGKLVSLEWLPVFVVGKDVGSKLNELNGLKNLRGSLTIKNLENVSSSRDTAEVNLAGKPKLVLLELEWNEVQEGASEETSFHVLEDLEPHGNIKELEIRCYGGARFANWMMLEECLLTNLTRVTLSKCRRCPNLPPFGKLQFLETLILEEMDALEFIESSRQGSNQKKSFPSLRELRLLNLPNLKGWATKNEDKEPPEASFLSSLTCLVELTLSNCPKLTNMPLVPSLGILNLEGCGDILVQSILLPQQTSPSESNHISLPKLKELTVKHCDDLNSLPLRGLTSLEALEIQNCPRLTSFTEVELQGLSSLLYLQMFDCESFTTLSAGMRYLTSLKTIFLRKLPKLFSLPEELQKSTKLQFLVIVECEGLMTLPDWIGNLLSLQTFGIVDCPNLKYLPDGMQLLTNLQHLQIGCDGLLSWPNWLAKLTSITELGISFSSDHMPEQLQHLTSLQKLHIESCQALGTLPEWLMRFSSLQHLLIINCPGLQCLPEQMKVLARLKRVEIEGCDKLTSRCKKGTGEDWPKIAHVPTIIINDVIM